jgi:hypothetical protein
MVEERSSVTLIAEGWKLMLDVWAFLSVTYVSRLQEKENLYRRRQSKAEDDSCRTYGVPAQSISLVDFQIFSKSARPRVYDPAA